MKDRKASAAKAGHVSNRWLRRTQQIANKNMRDAKAQQHKNISPIIICLFGARSWPAPPHCDGSS
eukprot:5361198-Prymnesium_polylepis.1